MKLACFGHYDSRGGTSAYAVSDFTQAERERVSFMYNRGFGLERDAEGRWGYPNHADTFIPENPADEDWLGWAELDLGGIEIPDERKELDDYDDFSWVLARGNGVEDDFVQDWPENEPLQLKLVPQGTVVEGYYHARWDDDAFAFLLADE